MLINLVVFLLLIFGDRGLSKHSEGRGESPSEPGPVSSAVLHSVDPPRSTWLGRLAAGSARGVPWGRATRDRESAGRRAGGVPTSVRTGAERPAAPPAMQTRFPGAGLKWLRVVGGRVTRALRVPPGTHTDVRLRADRRGSCRNTFRSRSKGRLVLRRPRVPALQGLHGGLAPAALPARHALMLKSSGKEPETAPPWLHKHPKLGFRGHS